MSSLIHAYTAGNWIRCSTVLTPQGAGIVALADVKAWTIVGTAATTTDVTAPSATSGGVLAGAVDPTTRAITPTANCFYVDVLIPDAAAAQGWYVRWESNPPSPKIAVESATATFTVLASRSPTP